MSQNSSKNSAKSGMKTKKIKGLNLKLANVSADVMRCDVEIITEIKGLEPIRKDKFDLVPRYTYKNEHVYSARDLWVKPGSKRQFGNWIERKLKTLDFHENIDYTSINNIVKRASGGNLQKDYLLKIRTGKHIAMSENTETGKIYRDYFLYIEKKLNADPKNSLSRIESQDARKNLVQVWSRQGLFLARDYAETTNKMKSAISIDSGTGKKYYTKTEIALCTLAEVSAHNAIKNTKTTGNQNVKDLSIECAKRLNDLVNGVLS